MDHVTFRDNRCSRHPRSGSRGAVLRPHRDRHAGGRRAGAGRGRRLHRGAQRPDRGGHGGAGGCHHPARPQAGLGHHTRDRCARHGRVGGRPQRREAGAGRLRAGRRRLRADEGRFRRDRGLRRPRVPLEGGLRRHRRRAGHRPRPARCALRRLRPSGHHHGERRGHGHDPTGGRGAGTLHGLHLTRRRRSPGPGPASRCIRSHRLQGEHGRGGQVLRPVGQPGEVRGPGLRQAVERLARPGRVRHHVPDSVRRPDR